MRRDYFDANVHNPDDEQGRPVLTVSFEGPDGLLSERLLSDDGTLGANDVDVTFRLTEAGDEADATGVLSVADRLTGEFVLEANLEREAVFELVQAGKELDGEDRRYRLRLLDSDGGSTVFDKDTLLVYEANGSLLRNRSLIPGGVEL